MTTDNKKRVITISREFGSGGRLIGQKIAEKLNVPYYDKKTFDDLAEKAGFSRRMIEEDEKRAKSSFLYNFSASLGTIEAGERSFSLNDRFFLFQFETIRELATDHSCVIVGRCADYVLRDLPWATNVFIYGEEADKIRRATELYGVPENQVKKMMKETDKARAVYYSYHTGHKWSAHENFHLALDSGYLSIDDIADLIILYNEKQIQR